MTRKLLIYFTVTLVFNVNFSIFGQENNNILKHNVVGLAVAKGGTIGFDEYPVSGIFYAGHERNLFQDGSMCHLALEVRLRGGFTFWREQNASINSDNKQGPLLHIDYLYIDDYLIGTSLLPRFYFWITENFQLFLDGEIGGAYHYIKTKVSLTPTPEWDKTGDVLTPVYGFHIGINADRYSLWAGLFTTDSKSKINKLLPQNVQVYDNIKVEAGFGFYF